MGWFHGRDGHRPDEQRPSGVKGDAFALGLGRRVAKPEVAHRAQAAWQYMPEISVNKFSAFERFGAHRVAVGAILPAEADMGITH